MARSALREIIQSIHRRNPSISEPEKTPETPGTPYALNGDDPFSGLPIDLVQLKVLYLVKLEI